MGKLCSPFAPPSGGKPEPWGVSFQELLKAPSLNGASRCSSFLQIACVWEVFPEEGCSAEILGLCLGAWDGTGGVGMQTFHVGASVSEPGWTVPRGGGGWPRRWWTAGAWGRAGGVGCAGKAIKRCEPYYWNAIMFIRAWGQEVQMFLENKPHLVVVWRENGNKLLIRLPLSGSVYAGFEWIYPRDFGKQLPQYFSYFQFGKLTPSGEWLKYLYLEIFWADYCFRGRINESVFQKDCKRRMTKAYVLASS